MYQTVNYEYICGGSKHSQKMLKFGNFIAKHVCYCWLSCKIYELNIYGTVNFVSLYQT